MILTWGALNLTATPYLVEFGLDPGAPANEAVALPFLLQDGEIELSNRAGNRTLQFNVLIEGASLTVLATAEAALLAESEKLLNTLTLDPQDGAPVAVYEVFRGQVTLVRDDDFETARLRRYAVTVRAFPFVRSAATFSSVAIAATGTTTTNLDTCGAITGWTATQNGAAVTPVFAAGPPTTVSATATLGPATIVMTKTFAATTTSLKYLIIDWKPTPSGGGGMTVTGDGVSLPKIAEAASPTSGFTRSWFYVAAASLAVTQITAEVGIFGGPIVSPVLALDNVAISDVRPISGTGRQQLRSVAVPGSARTQGSLAVESATAALGDTLVYVYPADTTTTGYSPPMRQFRTSGNTVTADAAQVSGSTEPLTGSAVVFSVPIGLFPRGQYLLMGRMATSGGGTPTISHSTSTSIGGTGKGSVIGTPIQITTTTAYKIFTLARLQLPTVDLNPAAALAGATMDLVISASTTCTYDEFWLFNTSIGSLVQVACGTGAGTVGGSARRLFIEPPSVTTPRPTVRTGHSADRSDSFYPDTFAAWQFAEFKPDQANVLTVTTNATDANVTLSGYARWNTNPAS